MSATLYALIVWQGASGLAFQPGYTLQKRNARSGLSGPPRYLLAIRSVPHDLDGVF